MTQPTTLKIDNVEYVRADSLATGDPTAIQIVVADRGWVFVGNTEHDEKGITIANARCIRYWGTDDKQPGLGWLALNGPTAKTKLDVSGTVRIPLHSVVATFDARADKWQ